MQARIFSYYLIEPLKALSEKMYLRVCNLLPQPATSIFAPLVLCGSEFLNSVQSAGGNCMVEPSSPNITITFGNSEIQ